MKVQLNYFKLTGKWYASGEFETNKEHMHEIDVEIRYLMKIKQLPGLVINHSDFFVVSDVPKHKYNVPRLFVPEGLDANMEYMTSDPKKQDGFLRGK